MTVRSGSVGPKIETEGTARAVARCSGPLSLVTTTEQCEMAAARCSTSPPSPMIGRPLLAAAIASALADAGGEGHHRRAEGVWQDHGAAEAARLQQPDTLARIAVPRDDVAEDAGRCQQRGDVLRRSHGDAAFAAEAVVERAVRG